MEMAAIQDLHRQLVVSRLGSRVMPGKTEIVSQEQKVEGRFGSPLVVTDTAVVMQVSSSVSARDHPKTLTYGCEISRVLFFGSTGRCVEEIFPSLTIQSSSIRIGKEGFLLTTTAFSKVFALSPLVLSETGLLAQT